MRKTCDLSQFLRGHGPSQDRHSRVYRLVAVMTAKWVLRRRRRFEIHDMKLRRIPIDPRTVHLYVGEFLSSWETPEDAGHSLLSRQMVDACPALHEKVTKFWKGY